MGKKKIYTPINDYNVNFVIHSINELIYGSEVFKVNGYTLKTNKHNMVNLEEKLAFLDKDGGQISYLSNFVIDDNILLYATSTSKNDLNNIITTNQILCNFKPVIYETLFTYLFNNITYCYKNEAGEKIDLKGQPYSQQIIANFLDLLCGGVTTLLPEHGYKGKNTEGFSEIYKLNKDKPFEDIILRCREIDKNGKENNFDYNLYENNQDLCKYIDKLKKLSPDR